LIFVLDNYDSFTYNLVQYLGEMGCTLKVRRNDQITVEQIAEMSPQGLLISPGPGVPDSAGISLDAIRRFAGRIPILGVCLGHQAIGQVFGGEIVRGRRPVHGKTSWIRHDGKKLFAGCANPFEATRYHSLIVRRETLPSCLEVTAWTDDGEIMGLRHRQMVVEGVQFHPESIMTREGKRILRNFVSLCTAD
jgi:anthranilate synthase/aminodeoxychorismate synthase-like glutamine amidotransferase